MAFYHGTSSMADISDKIVSPDNHAFGINESGRKKHSTRVFFTTNRGYAQAYARRCCKRVGGEPTVYEVVSSRPKLLSETRGCDVWYDNEALVLQEVVYDKNIF